MDGIYFVDDDHKFNYSILGGIWDYKSTEYQVACYILAVPMIYRKVFAHVKDFEEPIDWIWNYLNWLNDYEKVWDKADNLEDVKEYTDWIDRKPYDLTGSMVRLGELAMNLWNGYDNFNLVNCLASLDSYNYNVLKCAIDMRMGLFKVEKTGIHRVK